MAQMPKAPENAIELLTNQGLIEEPYVNKFWGPVVCGGLMFLGACIGNWFTKRPMLAGIQKHVLCTAAGIFVGKYADEYRQDYVNERDAVFRHYIQLHPEDFPPFERKKYADVLERWVPIR